MTKLDLRNLDTLTELKSALRRFAAEAQESLQVSHEGIDRTREWVATEIQRRQRQVEDSRRAVAQAENALHRCQASGYRDDRGIEHRPNCSVQERTLIDAQAKLRQSQENLQLAQRWQRRLEQGIGEYERQARLLDDLVQGHTDRACARLERSSKQYEAVLAAAYAVGASSIMASGGLGLGLAIDTFIAGTNLVMGLTNHSLGEAGEGISSSVVVEQMGLAVVPFDRRRHGFDGILQAPNGQYVLLESKTSNDGKLHLNPDSYGHRQTSVGWVAAVAERMMTPGHELYSETNAQIGQAILAAGPEKVPMLAAVVNTTTNRVSIMLRIGPEAETADWTLLSDDNPVEVEV